MIERIKHFFMYVTAYWTHHTIFQLKKGFLDEGIWYMIATEIRVDPKDKRLEVANAQILKSKPKEESKIIKPN